MSRRKKRFRDTWVNQTEIGRRFGVSAVEIGNLLVRHGLKDRTSRTATQKAFDGEFAKSTPLKDGTPFCLWNIDKIHSLISESIRPLTEVEMHVNDVLETFASAEKYLEEGNDKIAYMMADYAYEEVPSKIREEVRRIVEEKRSKGE